MLQSCSRKKAFGAHLYLKICNHQVHRWITLCSNCSNQINQINLEINQINQIKKHIVCFIKHYVKHECMAEIVHTTLV